MKKMVLVFYIQSGCCFLCYDNRLLLLFLLLWKPVVVDVSVFVVLKIGCCCWCYCLCCYENRLLLLFLLLWKQAVYIVLVVPKLVIVGICWWFCIILTFAGRFSPRPLLVSFAPSHLRRKFQKKNYDKNNRR